MSRHQNGKSIRDLDAEARKCTQCIARSKKVRANNKIKLIKNEFDRLDQLYIKGNTSLNIPQERQKIIDKHGLTEAYMRKHKLGEFKGLGAVKCGLPPAPKVNQGGSLADMFSGMRIKR